MEKKIIRLKEVDSTNTFLKNLDTYDEDALTIAIADYQTAGRGQGVHTWESEPGKNLLFSMMMYPKWVPLRQQFLLSEAGALAVKDALDSYTDGITLKWPNDVYVGDKKMVGILIEHTVSGAYVGMSLCGVGINVNQRVFVSDAPNPVSLSQLLGHELPLQDALAELLECIGKRYEQVHNYHLLEHDFIEALYRRYGEYEWKDEAGVFRASIAGVDEYGRLVLRDSGGKERVYGFKEVKYL